MHEHHATLYKKLAPSWSCVSLPAGVFWPFWSWKSQPVKAMCHILGCTDNSMSHQSLSEVQSGTLMTKALARVIKDEFEKFEFDGVT